MLHFYTPWKHQKTFGFLKFSGEGGGRLEKEPWANIG